MKTIREHINESSLGRVFQHAKDKDTGFAMITAFRGKYTEKENMERNVELAKRIKADGFGYFFVNGHWLENEGEDNEKQVRETSLFIINKNFTDDKFIKLMSIYCKKYNQDGVLIKNKNGEINIYDKNEKIIMKNLGKFNVRSASTMYSELKGSNKSFVFETARKMEFGSFVNAILYKDL
jgi:hypothetical protein